MAFIEEPKDLQKLACSTSKDQAQEDVMATN